MFLLLNQLNVEMQVSVSVQECFDPHDRFHNVCYTCRIHSYLSAAPLNASRV